MAAFELSDLPYVSPELIWSCTEKTSKYRGSRVPRTGADSYYYSSCEPGNLTGYHLANCTGLRHSVTFDLDREQDGSAFILTEIEPHSQKPSSSRTTHSVSASESIKTCYEDILKITREKRPDLDRAIWFKLKALYTSK